MWLLLLKGGIGHNSVPLLPPILKDDLLFTVLRKTNKGGGTVQSRLRAYMAVFNNGLQCFYSLLQVELSTDIISLISAFFSCPKTGLFAFRYFFFSEH